MQSACCDVASEVSIRASGNARMWLGARQAPVKTGEAECWREQLKQGKLGLDVDVGGAGTCAAVGLHAN